MSRSILPPSTRRDGAQGRAQATPGAAWSVLPPTPPMDCCDARGVSLVELARTAQEVAS